jgi:hypothetical protein
MKIAALLFTFIFMFSLSAIVSADDQFKAQSGKLELYDVDPDELFALNGEWLF